MDEITRIELRKLFNTRDIGGLKTEDGRSVKSGVLYRSGLLHKLPKKTVRQLETLDINTIIDLRTDVEANQKPDVVFDGVNYVRCPVICTATPGITYEEKIAKIMYKEGKVLAEKYGTSDNYMTEMYRHIVTEENSVKELKHFFEVLLSDSGNVLFHCNSGKDRAGVCAMLLESVLGVKKQSIIRDYVASRAFCRKKFFGNKVGLVIAPISFKFKKFLFCLMRVKDIYIKRTMEYLDRTYGSVIGFCQNVLGLTTENIETLRSKYLT